MRLIICSKTTKLQKQEKNSASASPPPLPLRPSGRTNRPDRPQTGQVAWAAKLDPWCNVLQEYNPQGINKAIRHHDRETGLYCNRHRYYDPVVGPILIKIRWD